MHGLVSPSMNCMRMAAQASGKVIRQPIVFAMSVLEQYMTFSYFSQAQRMSKGRGRLSSHKLGVATVPTTRFVNTAGGQRRAPHRGTPREWPRGKAGQGHRATSTRGSIRLDIPADQLPARQGDRQLRGFPAPAAATLRRTPPLSTCAGPDEPPTQIKAASELANTHDAADRRRFVGMQDRALHKPTISDCTWEPHKQPNSFEA